MNRKSRILNNPKSWQATLTILEKDYKQKFLTNIIEIRRIKKNRNK